MKTDGSNKITINITIFLNLKECFKNITLKYAVWQKMIIFSGINIWCGY